MYTDVFEQVSEFNKNFSKPFAQYQAFIAQTAEKLTKLQINTANEWMNLNIKHAQSLSSIKKPEDYLGLNSNYLSESASKCMENFNQIVNTTLQASAEYNKLLNDGMKTFTEEATKATKGKAA